MKIFYKKASLPDIMFITAVIAITVIVTAGSIFILHEARKSAKPRENTIVTQPEVCNDSIVSEYCILTVYNPGSVIQKTTFKTAWGDSINPEDPQRWICAGIDIKVKLGLKHGDTVMVSCDKCPYINGAWLFMDQSYNKGVAEILVSNPHEVLLGFKHPAVIYKKYGKRPGTH